MINTSSPRNEADRARSHRYYVRHQDTILAKQRNYRSTNREYFRRRSHDQYWRKVWQKLGKKDGWIQKWLDEHYQLVIQRRIENEFTRENQ